MTETAGKFTGFGVFFFLGILWLINLINITITASKTRFLNHFTLLVVGDQNSVLGLKRLQNCQFH